MGGRRQAISEIHTSQVYIMKLCLNDRFPSEMEIELSLLQFYLLKLTTPAHEEAEGNCFSFQDVGRNPSRVWT